MFLKELPESVYEDAVLHSGKPHFMQSSAWGEVNEKRHYTIRRIGLFDGDVCKGTALLLEKKILRWKSYYCPRGFLCDYSDHELVKQIVLLLKDYVKKNGGLYLKTDADILIRKLNDDGSVKETFEDRLALLPLLASLGGTHKGFTTRFVDTAAPRFTFRVNVDKTDEEFLASFHSTTRNILKRNNPYHLHFVKGGKELIPSFYRTMKETSLRKQMYLEPESFFEDFHEILHKHDMSDVYIVYALKSELLELYKQKRESIDAEKEKLLAAGSKKALNRLKDFEDMEKKLDKELAQVQEMDEEKIVLSGMITAKYADKVWTVHGGNADHLKFLNANYELYYGILRDARDMGYHTVDFFGTEGTVDPSSDIYGIYLFKLRFAGDFDEFLGEFDFVVRPLLWSSLEKLILYRRKLLIRRSLKQS